MFFSYFKPIINVLSPIKKKLSFLMPRMIIDYYRA